MAEEVGLRCLQHSNGSTVGQRGTGQACSGDEQQQQLGFAARKWRRLWNCRRGPGLCRLGTGSDGDGEYTARRQQRGQQRRRGSVRLGQSKKEAATKIDGSDVGVGGARRTRRRPGVKMPTVWACGDAAE